MTIEVDVETLEQSDRGSITGVIRLIGTDCAFPDERWKDFPVVLLSWWLPASLSLLRKDSSLEKFSFMDGPFHFTARRQEDVLHIECTRSASDGEQALQHITIPIQKFVASLRKATSSVLDVCKNKGWHSSDIERLRSIASHY